MLAFSPTTPTSLTIQAGLPAMAVGQLPEAVNGLSLSRASPLPQGSACGREFGYRHNSNVGAGLPAMAVGQLPEVVTGLPLSRASPLPQWDLCQPQLRPFSAQLPGSCNHVNQRRFRLRPGAGLQAAVGVDP
ncbi:hypothetical protein FIV37_25660 [Pseudomonas gessardii]|nr:hypothetical protein [Pseudomonas gessardii]